MARESSENEETPPELALSAERAFFIIVKAREFDEKVAPAEPDPGSNPTDDKEVDILEDYADDPTVQELNSALSALNIDEQLDVLALTWLGRGDFSSFAEAREQAADMSDKHIPSYLMGTPQFGDFLEEGLAKLDISLDEFEINRL